MAARRAQWVPDLRELEEIHRDSAALVKETPVFSFGELSRRCGGQIALKAENLQRTGSFKLRGALAKLRGPDASSRRGVVAGSAGNHGQALAYAARARGLPCTVFMPRRAAISKVDAVTAFGAEVRQEGDTVDDCVEAAKRLAVDRNLLFVHPFDDLEIVKGQAGIGLEIGRQVNDVARVVVPVGGGGLIGGVAATLRLLAPGAEVVGVQAAGCAPFRSSLRAGRPVPVANPSTIADGIAIKRPGDLTLGLVERWVDEMVAVDDDAIAEAIVLIAERAKLVVEGAGAVAVAALAAGVVAPAESGTTVALLSGGNIDPHMLAAVINRHQTGIGRRMRLFTRVSDHPGGLAGVLQTVAAAGANVLDVTHVRDGVPLRVGETGLEMLVECRGREHGEELMRTMRAAGYPADELGTEE